MQDNYINVFNYNMSCQYKGGDYSSKSSGERLYAIAGEYVGGLTTAKSEQPYSDYFYYLSEGTYGYQYVRRANKTTGSTELVANMKVGTMSYTFKDISTNYLAFKYYRGGYDYAYMKIYDLNTLTCIMDRRFNYLNDNKGRYCDLDAICSTNGVVIDNLYDKYGHDGVFYWINPDGSISSEYHYESKSLSQGGYIFKNYYPTHNTYLFMQQHFDTDHNDWENARLYKGSTKVADIDDCGDYSMNLIKVGNWVGVPGIYFENVITGTTVKHGSTFIKNLQFHGHINDKLIYTSGNTLGLYSILNNSMQSLYTFGPLKWTDNSLAVLEQGDFICRYDLETRTAGSVQKPANFGTVVFADEIYYYCYGDGKLKKWKEFYAVDKEEIDSKVDRSGDTMTGTLIVEADIEVTGKVDSRDVSADGAKLDKTANAVVPVIKKVEGKNGARCTTGNTFTLVVTANPKTDVSYRVTCGAFDSGWVSTNEITITGLNEAGIYEAIVEVRNYLENKDEGRYVFFKI